MKKISFLLVLFTVFLLSGCTEKYEGFRELKVTWEGHKLFSQEIDCFPTDSLFLYEYNDVGYYSTELYNSRKCTFGLYVENETEDDLIEITDAFFDGYVDPVEFNSTMVENGTFKKIVVPNDFGLGYVSYEGYQILLHTPTSNDECVYEDYTVFYGVFVYKYISYNYRDGNGCYQGFYVYYEDEIRPLSVLFDSEREIKRFIKDYNLEDYVSKEYHYLMVQADTVYELKGYEGETKYVGDNEPYIRAIVAFEINETAFVDLHHEIDVTKFLEIKVLTEGTLVNTFYMNREMIVDIENSRFAYIEALDFQAYTHYYGVSVRVAPFFEHFNTLNEDRTLTYVDVTNTTVKELVEVRDEFDELIGYALFAGFEGRNGPVEYGLHVNLDGEIVEFIVLEHSETPGLGANIEEDDFIDNIEGSTLLQVSNKEVDMIVGATMTSYAFFDSVDEVREFINQLDNTQ